MKNLNRLFFCILLIASFSKEGYTCTIFCSKDSKNQIWVGNNEDRPFSFSNYINIFPKNENTNYGYYTLSYDSPEKGENAFIEGGMNEAGLFFDMNSLDTSGKEYLIKNLSSKKSFPKGDDSIFSHILSNFQIVQEVVDFFDIYWFDLGFKGAQMHVADKFGTFGIIGPDGSRILTSEKYQISTNYSVCGNESSSDCWRYPIAEDLLSNSEASFELFRNICEKTSQKDYINTIYSNILNLNTGEIWFFFGLDYDHSFNTNIEKLLSRGRVSLIMRDLFSDNPFSLVYSTLHKKGGVYALKSLDSLGVDDVLRSQIELAIINSEILEKYNFDSYPILSDFLERYNPDFPWLYSLSAIYNYLEGNKEQALLIINSYKLAFPESSWHFERLLNRFQNDFIPETAASFVLNGFENASIVFVKGLPLDVFPFLEKDGGLWKGNFELKKGIYNYSFVVDGKPVFDSKTPVKFVSSLFNEPYQTHQFCLGFTDEVYMTTIRVRVPSEEDVVYIAGNQDNLTNWSSNIRMKKISQYERELKLPLHYPVFFKFTGGNWSAEAIVKGNEQGSDGNWKALNIEVPETLLDYEIIGWKNELIR